MPLVLDRAYPIETFKPGYGVFASDGVGFSSLWLAVRAKRV
jgi:hypothetical protein